MLSSKSSCRYNSNYWMLKRIIHQGAQEVIKIIIKYPEKGTSLYISQASNCFAQNQMHWSWGAKLASPKCSFGMKIILMKTIRARKTWQACSPNGGVVTDIRKDSGLSGGETVDRA